MNNLSFTRLKHSIAMTAILVLRNYARSAGSGLLGTLSEKEQLALKQLKCAEEALEDLCAEYYEQEELAGSL